MEGRRKSDEVIAIAILVHEVMPFVAPLHILHGVGYDASFLLTTPIDEILNLYAIELQRREEREGGNDK